MPELPEVETIRTDINASSLIGKKIISVDVLWRKTLDQISTKDFIKNVVGKTLIEAKRRGKFLILELNKGFIIIHLRMTGKLLLTNSKQCRLCFHLSNGETLYFNDQRKFGRMRYTESLESLSHLGPEPFELTETFLAKKLLRTTRSTKQALLDQTVVAGLGNIYVDEALFLAAIHPERKASSLLDREITRLIKCITEVIKTGIKNRGTSLGSHRSNYTSFNNESGRNQTLLYVYQRDGKPCKRCSHLIEKIRHAGRGTHLCPNCQKKTTPQNQ